MRSDRHDADLTGSDEFDSGTFDRTLNGDTTRQRHRRRRSSKRRKKKSSSTLTLFALAVFSVALTCLGILVGMNYRPAETDGERQLEALQALEAARDEWLAECAALGHTEWTCRKFDRVHFEKARKLDDFRCDPEGEDTYRCLYRLGDAEVLISLSDLRVVNGEYVAPRKRSRAIIGHSDEDEDYYVSVSEKGYIELRARETEETLFVINPATGSMNALHVSVQPDG